MNRAERRRQAARDRSAAKKAPKVPETAAPARSLPEGGQAPPACPPFREPPAQAPPPPADRAEHAREHLRSAAETRESGLLWEIEDQSRWYAFEKPAGETLKIGNMDAEELEAALGELATRGHAFIDEVREWLVADLHARLSAYEDGLALLRIYPEARTVWEAVELAGGDGDLDLDWLPEWDEDVHGPYPPT